MSRTVICPICGNNNIVRLFEKQGCTFVQCAYDKLVYINPQPDKEELQEIYDTYGKEFYVLPKSIATTGHYPDYRRRFLDFRRTNRLLEIGAAAGGFLAQCRNDGWETYGVELSVPSSKFAREQQGLNVMTGTIHDAEYPNEIFDVAVAWKTLEHVPNPREVITEIYRVLRSGGFFVMSVPYWKGLSIRLIEERYRYVGKDHLFYFSPQNLSKMLKDIGFSKICSKTGGFNPIVCYQDMRGLPKRSEGEYTRQNKVSQFMVSQLKKNRFLKVIHKVYYNVIERINLGAPLFAEGVKE